MTRFYEKYGALSLALLSALLMAFILFGGNGAGLSNNGDYTRIMKTNSLDFVTPLNVPYVYQAEFRMDFEGEDGDTRSPADLIFSLDGVDAYPSIHLLFIRASMAANMGLNALAGAPMETYRVQVLGLIYLLCYAGLFLLLFRSFSLPKPGVDLLVKLLMLFVLCDEGYITYFNSLYSEPVQIIGLLALATFALRAFTGKGRLCVNITFLFLSCVVYGWAKFVNLPVGALCILVLGGVLLIGATKRQRVTLAAGGLACVIALGAVYLSLPKWMDEETNYNAVFFGVLKDAAPERQADYLADLGLPQSMADLSYSAYYSQRGVAGREVGDFSGDFEGVSKFDLLFFYLRHPGYLMEKLDVAVGHSGFIRPFYLSNLGEDQVRLSFLGRFGGWSYLRGQLPFDTWLGNGLLIALGCFSIWRLLRVKGDKKSAATATLAVLTVLGALAYHLIMPIVTNGEADLAKHMFALAQIVDLLLLFLIARLGYHLCACQRLKYPVPVLAGGLAAVVLLGLFAPAALRWARTTGNMVTLGTWEGKAITWQVVARNGNTATLWATESVATLPFSVGGTDSFGSNEWTDSSLRDWLNGPFLDGAFTDGERAMLIQEEHPILLSGPNQAMAESGYNDFYCFHIPAYSDRAMDLAFAKREADTIRLPDIALLASLSRASRLSPVPCWMDTPYYNNGSMLRVMAPDGYFYMRDAAVAYGVRPVITVDAQILTK